MTYLDQLKTDHTTLTDILTARKEQTPEHPGPGVLIVHHIYLQILEDALKILDSLISFHET